MVRLAVILIGILAMVHIINCQVWESCRKDAYPPKQNDEIEEVIVNLDLPPKERWTHVIVKHKKGILNFIKYLKELVPPAIFDMLTNFIAKGIHKFPKPYGDEIIGIADALDAPLAHALACNIFYELEKVCTSIVAQDENGHIYHGRNLDLGALLGWDFKGNTWKITELLRPLTIAVSFQSGGKTLFKTVQFAGTVGVFTGIAPGRFSFSLNSRSPAHFFGGPLGVISWVLSSSRNKQFASILARDVLENAANYEEAVERFTTEPLLAPVYYIVGGIKPNQGTVITRSKTASIKPLKLSKSKPYLVQTNYDNWKTPPFYDNRRKPANICMTQTVFNKKLNRKGQFLEMVFNVLSTIPVLNKATIYTTLMSARTGEIKSYRRNCVGNCYPW